MTSETKGSPYLQYVAAATATLAVVTDGMHYGWSSPSVPQLRDPSTCDSVVCIDDGQGSTLAVMPLLGAVAGSLAAATIVDVLGRKRTVLATCLPFFCAWLLVAFARSVAILCVARFVAGVADGVTFTVVPMYIGEIAEPKVRGMLGSSCSVSWIAGFLVINVLGSYLTIRTAALVSAAVPGVLFLTFLWIPESPYYLLMRGKVAEARKVLRSLRSGDDKTIDEDISRMRAAIQSEEQNSRRGRFLELFTVRSNLKAVIIISGLRGFQQLSGTTAIAFYTHEIFKAAGVDGDMSTHHCVMIYYSVQLLMTMISSATVDKVGRRPLLIGSMAGSAILLFLLGVYFYFRTQTKLDLSSYSIVFMILLVGFVVIFGLGMQSVPICMLGELFPTNVKAFALCLADIYFSVLATVAAKYLQISKSEWGLHVSFWGFALCSLMGLGFIVFFVPETKGKTLEAIQRQLRGEPEQDHYEEEEKTALKV